MTADFVLAGTGSRSLRIASRDIQVEAMDRCTEAVAQRVLEHGSHLVVMSGGAEGWDELLARVALRLRVRLWLALPNKGYLAHYWGRASLLERDRTTDAREIVDRAWRVTHVMEDVHRASGLYLNGVHSNFVRNTWMVKGHGEFSGGDDFVVWGPTSKGAAHCVAAIKRAGKWRDDMVIGPDSSGVNGTGPDSALISTLPGCDAPPRGRGLGSSPAI